MGPRGNPRGVAVAGRILYFYLSGVCRGLIRRDAVPAHVLWAAVLASLALLLASAKAHGRQLRLERELEGHHEVVFGGTNPAWVESRWRQDRIGFWSIVPVLAALFAWRAWPSGAGLAATAALLWAPIAGFVVMGLASQLRLARAWDRRGADEKRARSRWIREARAGSLAWWALVAGLVVAVALLQAL